VPLVILTRFWKSKNPPFDINKRVFTIVRQNVQLTHHFLDDMRLLANLLKDFDEP